ncbi:hypothetical protein [Mesorhizobium marinum]|uniref:hypothetical protein n=1 Tax=Mesorhizobium marinum TaxID=3228790 RepID=UPI00346732C5
MQLAAATSATPSRDHIVRDRLIIAARFLSATDDCGVPVLQRVSIATQNVLEAVYVSGNVDLAAVAPDIARVTATLLSRSAPHVADAADGKILPERIYFLLGAASGLLTNQQDPFIEDRIDYAAMLAAELAMLHHSRSISDRGFPMLRTARINAMLAEPRDPDKLLN